MLQLSQSLMNRPIMSLRTGEPIAVTMEPIINPNNLKIEGFFCHDLMEKRQPILVAQDIRDILPQGIVVNDYEVLSDAEDLVRLKDVLTLHFALIGKQVVTETGQKLGKVNDFTVETTTLYIQKLYVAPSLLKSLSSGQLGIDRTQIVEVSDKRIIVKDPLQGTKVRATASASAT